MSRDIDYIYGLDQMVVSKCGGLKCAYDTCERESCRNIRLAHVSASGLKRKCIWS